jgi:hypothetical protein
MFGIWSQGHFYNNIERGNSWVFNQMKLLKFGKINFQKG